MDTPAQSSERSPFKDLSNTINTSVDDTRNGGELTDVKEHNRQRARERYAQMDKQKKDELLKKRREAYHQKKYGPSVSTRESQDSPSPLSQLQSTPVVTGETAWNKKKVVPGDNDTYQGQESLLLGMKTSKDSRQKTSKHSKNQKLRLSCWYVHEEYRLQGDPYIIDQCITVFNLFIK